MSYYGEEEQHQQYCREREQQQSASAEAQANAEAATGQVRTCRVCHCTESNPCFKSMHGQCYWAEADLCSECKSESGETGG